MSAPSGILYPRASETRDVLSLDGLWDFTPSDSSDARRGHIEKWYRTKLKNVDKLEVQTMPVPASYNDIGTDKKIRDHVGPVWYQRSFYVPRSWNGQKVWIRFSSVCRAAEVWINGEWVVSHDIGHLPFQAEVSSVLNYGDENTVTVAVDNTLNQTSIPQGGVQKLTSGRLEQTYTFDFFNYAGIDRPVVLYSTPTTFIDDITVSTGANEGDGFVNYSVTIKGPDYVDSIIKLIDKAGKVIAFDTELEGVLSVPNATFWWPYLMNPNPGYLYSLQVKLVDKSGDLVDSYVLPVGIRTISWDPKTLKINKKPVYMRGFGRHEDSDIRGKGLDLPLIIKDYNLIKWVGANCFRTSHYPYAEEIMDLADQLGIMIIDECPAVDIDHFSDELLENHKRSLTELIQRDKNRPSVIMWSAANEPRTQHKKSKHYFKKLVAHIKILDITRPVTVVNNQLPDNDHSGRYLDVASFNIYCGWYSDTGDTDVITSKVVQVAKRWHKLHNIPVLVAEYGADTVAGFHVLPSSVWSEEYQGDFLSRYFHAFDQLRKEGFFIGEMIWNFADFQTAQNYTRVCGNKKGIFTRNRQPKASAHLLRRRYWALAHHLDRTGGPADLDNYVFETGTVKANKRWF